MQSKDQRPRFTLPRRPAGVLFDGDGVVFDSEELSIVAFIRTWEGFGLRLSREECGRFIGAGMQLVFSVMREEYGIDADPALFVERRDVIYKEVCAEVDGPKPMDGMIEFLEWLAAERIPYAIASSASADKLAFNLQRSGLQKYFPIHVHGDEVAVGKPAPDIFLEAARRIGVAPTECIVLEDSLNGLRGAIAAGAVPVAIEGSHHNDHLEELTNLVYRHPGVVLERLRGG